MQKEYVLITGANGEIGHSLITQLSELENYEVIALDITPLDEALIDCCCEFIPCNILDQDKLSGIFSTYQFSTIYHLASILSTRAESNPVLAQNVNVQGTLNLLEWATNQSKQMKKSVKFIYPSSIAVYGMPSQQVKAAAGKVKESEFNQPITMYGNNKLACENLGKYYATHYRLLDEGEISPRIDFRSIRFPGLISAFTIPTGGTSDYGPEMLHHAAQQKPYECFVRPDTRLPFMVMPDAVKSLLLLAKAPKESLTQLVYNVSSFNPSANELAQITQTAFSEAMITYQVNAPRQAIVDSWPEDIDDTAARADWGWFPDYDQTKSFDDYLIPNIKNRYQQLSNHFYHV